MSASEMLSARIPFAGFYESIWSSEIDHVQEMEFDDEYRLAETYPMLASIPKHERDMRRMYEVLWFDAASYGAMHNEIAKAYVDAFAYWLWKSLGLKDDTIEYEFEEMTSPREYNFHTDRIFAKFPERIFQAIIAKLPPSEVAATFHEMFTSRSGFHSFYDNSPPEKPLAEWDHNELYALFEAWVEHVCKQERHGDSIDWVLFEDLNDAVYTAVSNNTDWDRVAEEAEAVYADWVAEQVELDPTFVPPTPRCKYTMELPFDR